MSDVASITETKLRELLLRTDAVFHNSHDGIVAMNSRSEIVFVNEAAVSMFGYADSAELVGQRVETLMNDRIAHDHSVYVGRHLNGHDVPIMNQLRRIRAKHKSGDEFPIDIHVFHMNADDERYYVGFIRDMAEIEAKELELQRVAYFDTLTGLPNAASFRTVLNEIYDAKTMKPYLVATLGIDHMRTINSTFGFEQGDEVIAVVARRLASAFADKLFFGRLFGDQFVLAL